jgi:hypothetical protein
MRVDPKSNQPHHERGFGLGAHDPEPHETDVGLGVDHDDTNRTGHGLLEHLGDHPTEHFGGHVEVGHLDQDFSQHHDGLHGLHDSVGIGLGLGDDSHGHHSLHDALHDAQHDPQHHDPAADQHHDLGDLFHHG